MKKLLIFTLGIFALHNILYSQVIDINYQKNTFMAAAEPVNDTAQENKVQILKSGFVDFLSDGTIQASARLLRINIGDKDKFYLPFYIYTGAAGQAFSEGQQNQTTVANLLNPIGGTLNMSFIGMQNLLKGNNITKLNFAYQVCGRLLYGNDSSNASASFVNGFANAGLFFQTGAWTPEDPNNMGVFYLQAKFCTSFSPGAKLEKVFGKSLFSNTNFLGYSIDAGIEINKVIDLKLGLYQYINNQDISLLKQPVLKFSIDYSFN